MNEVQPLQEDSEGRLCADTKNVLLSIQPEAGMAVIFNHRLMHEGEALKAFGLGGQKSGEEVLHEIRDYVSKCEADWISSF